MMKKYTAFAFSFLVVLAIGAVSSTQAGTITKKKAVGSYEFELQVLPPEPFYTQSQVKSDNVQKGMVVERGAQPVEPNDSSRPNHHLVVHVFHNATGKAVTDADVKLSFQKLGPGGQPTGNPTQVPVVEMQVIGKGAATTHYGNNVKMPSGTYQVNVSVNGETAAFQVQV